MLNDKGLMAVLREVSVKHTVSISAIVVYLTYAVIGSSELVEAFGISQYMPLLLACSIVMACAASVIEFQEARPAALITFLSAFIVVVTTSAAASMMLFMSYIVVVSSRGLQRRFLAKVILFTLVVECSIVFVSSLAGIIPNNEIIAASNFDSSRLVYRHTLGFNHQNTVGGFLFAAYVCYVFLRYERLSLVDLIVSVGLLLFLYFYVNTKTVSIVLAVSILLIFASFLFKWMRRSGRKCYVSLSIFGLLLSMALPVMYWMDPVSMSEVNYLLTNRLQLSATGFEEYGITAFGQNVDFVSTGMAMRTGVQGFVLDNAFAHLVVQYGVVPMLLVYLFYICSLWLAYRRGDEALLFVLALVLISAIAENWLFNVAMNPLPLLVVSSHSSNDSDDSMPEARK